MKDLYFHIDEHKIAGAGDVFDRVTGWAFSASGRKISILVTDEKGEALPFETGRTSRPDVARAYHGQIDRITPEIGFEVRIGNLEKLAEDHEKIIVSVSNGTETEEGSTDDIRALIGTIHPEVPHVHVDNWVVEGDTIWINGWAYARGGDGSCGIAVLGPDGSEIPSQIDRNRRVDLCRIDGLSMNSKPGFQICVKRADVTGTKLTLSFRTAGDKKDVEIDVTPGARRNKSSIGFFKHVATYTRTYGLKGLIRRAILGAPTAPEFDYDSWFRARRATPADLEKQRNTKFACEPKISVCIPLYNTRPVFLRDIVNSIRAQSYQNWELCLADGSTDDTPGKIIASEYSDDSRIVYRKLEKNTGISGNTNEALKMATGDFIMLADHDDTVEPDALFEIVKAINSDPETDIVYTDEDVLNEKGTKYRDPHLKPDYSPDYLRSLNYITHIFVVRKTIIDSTGGFRNDCNGAQDWEMILHCCESARKVAHVPRILYHWRESGGSTAKNPDSKMYAVESGRRAIAGHMKRVGLDGELEYTLDFICFHPILYVHGEPEVSIVICSKDHTDLLSTCVNSILEMSTYKNFEIVIVENNSEDPKTFDYYREIQKKDARVKVVTYTEKGPFNYSKVNNFGVQHSEGEYIILLNNDTKVISANWIEGMLGYCQRDDVGIVGAKLYYEDLTVQHCGVVIGMGGFAGHVLTGNTANDGGYMMLLHATHNVSAVTAACMMTKKSVWHEVGGLTEDFRVALNDVDYCLKVRETGKLVVMNPAVELYHFESKSRGYEDTPERYERFKAEVSRFRDRWKEVLDKGDPYYNPNLSLMYNDYRVRGDNEHFDIVDEIEAEKKAGIR